MSVFSFFKKSSQSSPSYAPTVEQVFSGEADIRSLVIEAEKWMPSGTWYDYIGEMATRIAYYKRSMQADMKKRLQEWFPETYKEIWKQQFNLPILADTIRRKAQVFANPGKFVLLDSAGNRIEDGRSAELFQRMIDAGQFVTAFQDLDGYTQLCSRSMMVLQWDPRNERVKPSVWTPNVTRIVPHEILHWDMDSAYVIMLQMPGGAGMDTSDKRWMIYAKRWTGEEWQSRHYIAGSRTHMEPNAQGEMEPVRDKKTGSKVQDWYRIAINDGDILPFSDWAHDGEPMYPMLWFQSDTDAELYKLDDEDMLTVNRHINAVLTDMMHVVHLNAWPEEVYTAPQGEGIDIQAVIPGKRVAGPAHPEQLPPGVDKKYISPELPLEETTGVMQLLVDLDARLRGLPSTVVSEIKQTQGLSGIALKIRDLPLTKHIEKMKEVYYPQVCELLRRAIIVHDTYADEKIGEYRVEWEPGDMDMIEDPDGKTRRSISLVSKDVKTPVDIYMEETGETDRAVAHQRVIENAEINKSLSDIHIPSGIPYTPINQEPPKDESPEPETPEPTDEG